MDITAFEPIATAIQGFLVAGLIVLGPVLMVGGGVMIAASGVNPAWKQKGIETIKMTIVGSIIVGLVALGLWTFVQTNAELDALLG